LCGRASGRSLCGVVSLHQQLRFPGPSDTFKPMADTKIDFSHLSMAERLQLIGDLWDSLDPPPESPELLAELERRSADAEATPEAGRTWDELKADLRTRLR
jgi:putative addiction module component (TIGR02574 family)